MPVPTKFRWRSSLSAQNSLEPIVGARLNSKTKMLEPRQVPDVIQLPIRRSISAELDLHCVTKVIDPERVRRPIAATVGAPISAKNRRKSLAAIDTIPFRRHSESP